MYALIIQIVIALIQALIQYFANSDLPPAQRNKIALTTFGTSVLGFMASNYATTGSVLGGKIGGDGASKMAADAINNSGKQQASFPGVSGSQEADRTGIHQQPAVNNGSDANGIDQNGGGNVSNAEKPEIFNKGKNDKNSENGIKSKVMGASLFDTLVSAGLKAGDNLTHVIDSVANNAAGILHETNQKKIINETSKAVNDGRFLGLAAMVALAFILFRS